MAKSKTSLTFKPVEKQQKSEIKSYLLGKYESEIIAQLKEKFNYSNINEVPKITKIVINMGLGEAVQNPNIVKAAESELSLIAGQRAVITKAKKSISNFKLREGMPIGCMVTLRRERMWAFLERLTTIALPRVRDFKGINDRAFDGRGNYNMGIKDYTIFSEINYDKVDQIKGMNISIATTAKTDDEGRELLKALGMPFKKAAAAEVNN